MRGPLALLAAGLIGAAVGYGVGTKSAPPSGPALPQPSRTDVRQELAELTIDFEEYQQLKSQKERYLKADEILGKIWLLMIADLGLNPRPSLAPPAGPGTAPAEASPQSGESPRTAGNPNSGRGASRSVAKPDASSVARPDPATVDSPREVAPFLEQARRANLFDGLKNGGKLSADQLRSLEGHFTGRAVFDDAREVPWQIEMALNLRLEQGEYVGEYDISLRKNGKPFRRTRNTRRRANRAVDQDRFAALEGDPQALVLTAYGDDAYFQLYEFTRLNELHGIVYLKTAIGRLEPKGIVQLSKRP